MRRYLMVTLFFIVFALYGCAQNKSAYVQSGSFVCKINEYIIFSESVNTDGEYPSHSLNALDFQTKERILIGSNLLSSDCIGLSDNIVAYSNGKSVICWNSINKKKDSYLSSELDYEIVGLGIDQSRNNILLVQVDYKKYEMLIKIINTKTKTTTFQHKVKLNETEIEGIAPSISAIDNFFVFSIQDKLYSIDLKKPMLRLISSSCDAFALNNKGVVYYKFVTDESTEGYCLQLSNWQTDKIDISLNAKIYNCDKSFMITAREDKKYFPYYIICETPYIYSDNHWVSSQNVTIYRDPQVQVELPVTANKVNESIFIYNRLK